MSFPRCNRPPGVLAPWKKAKDSTNPGLGAKTLFREHEIIHQAGVRVFVKLCGNDAGKTIEALAEINRLSGEEDSCFEGEAQHERA